MVRWIFYSADGIEISGHEFLEDEICEYATVQVLKCKDCGKVDIGWWKN